MKNYLLFDLDGTLTDPKEGICTCVQYALDSFGIQEPDLDRLEPFIGPPLKDSFMEFYHMDEAGAEAAIEKYRERFQDKGIFENKLYDGIPEMLRALNSRGMFMAVASSKPTVYVRRILEHFKIEKYFKVVVGSELDGTRTSKAEVVTEALRQLFDGNPVDKTRVYMIGDRKYDVEGAHAFGVEAVGVTYGYGSMEELKEARADYIVRSVEELQKFLLRGTGEKEKLSASQRIFQLVIPFFMFLMVRNVAIRIIIMLLVSASSGMADSNFWFVKNAEGLLEVTGNGSAVVSALGYVAGALSILTIAKRTLTRTAEDMKLMHIREESGKSYALLALAAVGLVLGGNVVLSLSGLAGASETYQEVAGNQYSASLLVGVVCYALITPIAEELLFRGVMYNCLRRYMKLSAAMVMSSALFAIYHGNSVQGIYAFAAGCLMVYGYEYFGDFRICVGIHILANLSVYLLSNLAPVSAVLVNWPVGLVCLACAAGSVWLMHQEKKVF